MKPQLLFSEIYRNIPPQIAHFSKNFELKVIQKGMLKDLRLRVTTVLTQESNSIFQKLPINQLLIST